MKMPTSLCFQIRDTKTSPLMGPPRKSPTVLGVKPRNHAPSCFHAEKDMGGGGIWGGVAKLGLVRCRCLLKKFVFSLHGHVSPASLLTRAVLAYPFPLFAYFILCNPFARYQVFPLRSRLRVRCWFGLVVSFRVFDAWPVQTR